MTRTDSRALVVAVAAMAVVVVASNYLVQIPVGAVVGGLDLSHILTYGAFTYPLAFLVTDVVNRTFGPRLARRVAYVGFALAVVMSAILADPRIAIASGTAFLTAQLLDVSLFNRLRQGSWWRAPLASSLAGSALDTALFFTLAFSATIPLSVDGFATEVIPLFGVMAGAEAPRWVSWALADFTVKLMVAAIALMPYRLITAHLAYRVNQA
ncbi:MAG: VUT family protein [Devosia sp.]